MVAKKKISDGSSIAGYPNHSQLGFLTGNDSYEISPWLSHEMISAVLCIFSHFKLWVTEYVARHNFKWQ